MDESFIQSVQMLHILDKKDSNRYERMSQHDLMKELVSRDNVIVNLRQQMQMRQQMDNQKINIYKDKLGQEIQQNERVVSGFASITELIVDLINKMTLEQDADYRSTVLAKIRESGQAFLEESLDKSIEESANQSSFSCFDEIINQTFRLLAHLSTLIDALKQKLNDTTTLRASNNQFIDELWRRNAMLESLLQKTQKQKIQLTKSIFNSENLKDFSVNINQKSREELAELVLKQGIRIKELQKDKKDLVTKNRKEKEVDYKKYEQLLYEVKDIKNRRSVAVEI